MANVLPIGDLGYDNPKPENNGTFLTTWIEPTYATI